MRHIDRQVDDTSVLAQISRADDISRSEPLRILADETIERSVRPIVSTLDFYGTYLYSVPHKEIYLHRIFSRFLILSRVKKQGSPRSHERLRDHVLEKHPFVDSKVVIQYAAAADL